jgi:putative transposase
MGIARSTYYDAPFSARDDTAIVEAMGAICDEFEHYGWRRVRAALRHQGVLVNHKKIRRLMREHDLQPRTRRRFVATTDSDHDDPIFPNRVNGMIVDGPNQLWVADITYVAISAGFVYVAVILDAWSRRVVGYAISLSIDARLTVAALEAAIARRKPPPGCVHHSDRGSQLTFKRSSQHLNQGGCDGHSKATITPVWTRAVAVAGATTGSGTN